MSLNIEALVAYSSKQGETSLTPPEMRNVTYVFNFIKERAVELAEGVRPSCVKEFVRATHLVLMLAEAGMLSAKTLQLVELAKATASELLPISTEIDKVVVDMFNRLDNLEVEPYDESRLSVTDLYVVSRSMTLALSLLSKECKHLPTVTGYSSITVEPESEFNSDFANAYFRVANYK